MLQFLSKSYASQASLDLIDLSVNKDSKGSGSVGANSLESFTLSDKEFSLSNNVPPVITAGGLHTLKIPSPLEVSSLS